MALTSAQKTALEKKLGRPLSIREAIFEEIDRDDPRDMAQRMADDSWKPIIKQPQGESIYDSTIKEMEEAARVEAQLKMSPLERRIAWAKEARNKELAEKADQRAHQKLLDSDEVAKPVKALQELLKSFEWNPAITFTEAEAVRRTIEQYTTPGADLAVARAMMEQCFQGERDRRAKILDGVNQRLQELGADKEKLTAEIAALAPVQAPAPSTLKDKWMAWADVSSALYDVASAKSKAYDAIPQGPAHREARLAAMAESKAAYAAVQAHKATEPIEEQANAQS